MSAASVLSTRTGGVGFGERRDGRGGASRGGRLVHAILVRPVAPNILSVAHWYRILGDELSAPLSRVDWATLLRRTFDVDVKSCAACGGRMTVRAVVTDPASIARLLGTLRRPRAPPVAA